MTTPKTLYDKLVDSHVVRRLDPEGTRVLLYIDRTVLNEYTSPQAFSGLRAAGRGVWRPEAALGTVDHVNPTRADRGRAMPDEGAAEQARYFDENCRMFGALGFGIGTSDIEHYLATQTLVYARLKTMRVTVTGRTGPGVRSKDIIMALIGRIGTNPPFLVGDGAITPKGQTGLLQLVINDDLAGKYGAGLTDNEGQVSVAVTPAG